MILSFTSYVICYAIFVVICSFDSYATRATSAQTQRPPSARSSCRPPIMCAQERRIARDGGSYTLQDFLDYYGDELGHQYWAEARVAGAPQPGGPGPYAPPVGHDAPVAGAPQPGGPGPDAPPVGQDAPVAGAPQPGYPEPDVARPSVAPHLRAKAVLEVHQLAGSLQAAFSLQEACSVVGEGLALCHWTWTREHVQALSYSVPRHCAMVLAQPGLVECIHEALGRRRAKKFRH